MSSTKKQSIVLILTDDQLWDAFGAAGCPIETPNMDSLVKRRKWFGRCRFAGGTSTAICIPSRAMINTDRSLFELGDEGRTVPADHRLLGEVVREAGYATFGPA